MDLHARGASWVGRTAVALLAVVLMGACAKASTAGSASGSGSGEVGSNGTLVQITPAAADKVTTLHVGDTLRLVLGPPTGSYLVWAVRDYPGGVLGTPAFEQLGTRIDFVATAEGSGAISVIGMTRCGAGPGPYSAGVQCPVVGAESPTPPGAGGAGPARLLTFRIQVTG